MCLSSLIKLYELMLAKAGVLTDTPHNALAPCPWSWSTSWCPTKDYRNTLISTAVWALVAMESGRTF